MLVLIGMGIFAAGRQKLGKRRYNPFAAFVLALLVASPFFIYSGYGAYHIGTGIGELLYPPTAERVPVSSTAAKQYTFKVEKSMSGTGNVGNEWSFSYTVAGQQVKPGGTVELIPGEQIMVDVTVIEGDESMPDIGHGSKAATVDAQAFTVESSARVRENGGRHAGEYVTWNFTYTFTSK